MLLLTYLYLFVLQIAAQRRRRGQGHHRGSDRGNTCTTKFLKYEASPYEMEWTGDVVNREHHICSFLQRESNEQSLLYQVTHESHDQHFINMTRESIFRVFSMFIYEKSCTQASDNMVYIEPIEPIHGYNRDHRELCGIKVSSMPKSKTGLNDRRFLLLPSKTSFPRLFLTSKNYGYNPNILLFNIGCGSFKGNLNGSSSMGDSQAWFLRQYPEKGFKIGRIVLWESIEFKATDFFAQIPRDQLPKYQFYNTPISANPKDVMYPWKFLKDLAAEFDYVVVKLDVRDYEIEMSLLKNLMLDEELMSFIDEMFYEFHIRLSPMPDAEVQADLEPEYVKSKISLADVYDMFLKFRRAGMRMHGWP